MGIFDRDFDLKSSPETHRLIHGCIDNATQWTFSY